MNIDDAHDIQNGIMAAIREAGDNAKQRGFHDPYTAVRAAIEGSDLTLSKAEAAIEAFEGMHASTLFALIDTETAEAVECIRKGEWDLFIGEDGKPEGLPSEMADVFIRLCDAAYQLDIDLASAVELKLKYNRSRPFKHGGKAL